VLLAYLLMIQCARMHVCSWRGRQL